MAGVSIVQPLSHGRLAHSRHLLAAAVCSCPLTAMKLSTAQALSSTLGAATQPPGNDRPVTARCQATHRRASVSRHRSAHQSPDELDVDRDLVGMERSSHSWTQSHPRCYRNRPSDDHQTTIRRPIATDERGGHPDMPHRVRGGASAGTTAPVRVGLGRPAGPSGREKHPPLPSQRERVPAAVVTHEQSQFVPSLRAFKPAASAAR